ncbi:GNAT family N-acetyltransferase [bacterium]|nr:GNAT family N-acetyltransferase [bacterium]
MTTLAPVPREPSEPALPVDYSVEITSLTVSSELSHDWQYLQALASPSIFLDWLWLSTWLDSYKPTALVARVTLGNALVAMGVFAVHDERRHGFLRSRVALLHQVGNEAEDQIWVEYNGMLAAPEHEGIALKLACEALQRQGHCDEVHVSMALANSISSHFNPSRVIHVSDSIAGYQYGFNRSAAAPDDVLSTFSANTRYQIRRSIRGYENIYGTPRITAAATAEEALEMFHEAGIWHRERWNDSGFNNPSFLKFHEGLIKRGFHHGSTQLLRVSFGSTVIGVFYFLVSGRRVYFYLQGLRTEPDGKLKPGLTGHCLTMQYFYEQDFEIYDFMGGESQYKAQLSNEKNAFITLRLHNNKWRFRLEHRARQLKHLLTGR